MSTQDPGHLVKLSAKVLGGRAFLIKTPPSIQYFSHLTRWLTTGMLGALVYGRPRLGKTSATRWVLSAIKQTLGPVSCIEIPARSHALISEGGFFQHILTCSDQKLSKRGTNADRRDRVRHMLLTRARKSPIGAVIFFIDEAQLLLDVHFEWLMNISNELEADGYRLFCLLVGQHQLIARKEYFVHAGRAEIVGRFMTEDWAFPGITTQVDLRDCLKELDAAIYPARSDTPFIANFLPQAYIAGWRTELLTERLWCVFSEIAQDCGLEGGNMIIPMHYFSTTLTNLLNALHPLDARENIKVPEDILITSVERSGYRNALHAMKVAPDAESDTM